MSAGIPIWLIAALPEVLHVSSQAVLAAEAESRGEAGRDGSGNLDVSFAPKALVAAMVHRWSK